MAAGTSEYKLIEKQLRQIGSSKTLDVLGPIARAEVIRLLAFRALPLDLFLPCLTGVEALSVITKVDIKAVAIFIADFLGAFPVDSDADASILIDTLYKVIKNSPVPPEDFFKAFAESRRLLVGKTIPPDRFLLELRQCLASGVPPEGVLGELLQVMEAWEEEVQEV